MILRNKKGNQGKEDFLEEVTFRLWHFQFLPQVLLLLLSRFSRVRLLATLWTAAYQAPPSMGFSRQEYWSGVLLPAKDNYPL